MKMFEEDVAGAAAAASDELCRLCIVNFFNPLLDDLFRFISCISSRKRGIIKKLSLIDLLCVAC